MFVANVYRAQWKTFRHSWLDDEETPRHWAFNSREAVRMYGWSADTGVVVVLCLF